MPQLAQEAGAVVSQVVGDELAWRLGVRRRRRTSRMIWPNIILHLAVEKLWKTRLVEPQSHAGFELAVLRFYDARPGVKSLERGTCGKTSERARNFSALPKRLSPSRRSYGAAVRLRQLSGVVGGRR